MAMTHTIEGLRVRRDKLHKKDSIMNKNIVSKLDRKIRKMESQG